MKNFQSIFWSCCLLASQFIFLSLNLNGQTCQECRFYSEVFDSVSVTTVRFGEGMNGQQQLQELFMDVYQPVGDTMHNRPVVIFAFGGGFLQGSRTDGYVVNTCKRFARAGYVSAAIDYRIGFDVFGLFPNPVEELMRVFFRAMQDMRGSVQYMRAHADVMGNTWDIDTNRITIGGASAGAITALMVAYCDKDTEFEEMGSLSALSSLGGFYATSGDYPAYSWDVKQVMNVAGALVNAEWVEAGDPPVVSAHGDQDGTVPYQGGNLDLGFASIGLEGSYLVDQEAQAEGVCSYLYTMVGQDHPSGNMSDEELDQIFNRLMPRMGATMRGLSYCCGSGVEIQPGGEVGMIPGDSLTLNAVLSTPVGNETVQWCLNPCSGVPVGLTLSFVPQLPSQAIVISTDTACMSTDFVVLYSTVGIEYGEIELPFVLSPNPGSGQLHIQSPPSVAQFEVQVFNLNGKLEYAGHFGEGVAAVQTDFLAQGMYIVQIVSGDRVWKGRWVKQ